MKPYQYAYHFPIGGLPRISITHAGCDEDEQPSTPRGLPGDIFIDEVAYLPQRFIHHASLAGIVKREMERWSAANKRCDQLLFNRKRINRRRAKKHIRDFYRADDRAAKAHALIDANVAAHSSPFALRS